MSDLSKNRNLQKKIRKNSSKISSEKKVDSREVRSKIIAKASDKSDRINSVVSVEKPKINNRKRTPDEIANDFLKFQSSKSSAGPKLLSSGAVISRHVHALPASSRASSVIQENNHQSSSQGLKIGKIDFVNRWANRDIDS